MARDTLDLRGVKCPLSWARAKVRLESLAAGQEVDLLLDDAQGAADIPRAAEATGHHVVGVVDEGGSWRITIEVQEPGAPRARRAGGDPCGGRDTRGGGRAP